MNKITTAAIAASLLCLGSLAAAASTGGGNPPPPPLPPPIIIAPPSAAQITGASAALINNIINSTGLVVYMNNLGFGYQLNPAPLPNLSVTQGLDPAGIFGYGISGASVTTNGSVPVSGVGTFSYTLTCSLGQGPNNATMPCSITISSPGVPSCQIQDTATLSGGTVTFQDNDPIGNSTNPNCNLSGNGN